MTVVSRTEALTLFPDPKPRIIDLFAGAGGLTAGFKSAGFEPVFAVEIDKAAAETYRSNFDPNGRVLTDPTETGHVFACPIEEIEFFPSAEVIVGGPPCQGFSPLGKNRDDHSRAALNSLWEEYLRAVKQVRPLIFVIENVPEFLKSDQFATFLGTFDSDEALDDYVVEYRVLNAADYGVPQRRRRGIVIGSRVGAPIWPVKTNGPDADPPVPYATVQDWIGDLPIEPTNEDMHWSRNPTAVSMERYRAVPVGGNRFDLAVNRPDLLPNCWRNKKTGTTDVFGRLWADRPALTIRTEFFKPEKGRFLHPTAHRPITHREAARLQSFPDEFVFTGSKIEIAKQIGNAVPAKLGEAVAKAVMLRLPDDVSGIRNQPLERASRPR
jgi:DNA (cytosine-5)-methyltransferase 1